MLSVEEEEQPAKILSVEEEQQPEKKRQGEGCEIEEQKRLKLGEAMDEVMDEDTDEDGDMDMKVNQAEAKMSSVEGGRPFEEEELEKNPRGEGCELEEDPKKKPQGEGRGCESEEEYEDSSEEEYEESSEEEKEKEVVVPEESEEEEKEIVSLDEEEKGQKVADDGRDFLDAYTNDRYGMFQSAMNRSYMRGMIIFEGPTIDEPLHDDTDDFPKIRCHRFVQCDICNNGVFMGSPIFELFRVELYLRNPHSKPLSGKIYGAIEIDKTPENPHPVSYFYVNKENAIPFTLNPDKKYGTFSLPLSGPKTRPPVVKYHWFDLIFALKIAFEGNDVVEQYRDVFQMCIAHDNTELFDQTVYVATYSLRPGTIDYDQGPGNVLVKFLPHKLEDDFGVASYHTAYNGSWATVGVEIKKKGLSGFYGFIFARTSVFPNSRMYLLSIDKNQKRELQPSESLHSVVLTRKVVSAPTCSSLIIVADLWDQDGESIVKGKTFFPAKPNGTFGRFIGEKDVGIVVKVKWMC